MAKTSEQWQNFLNKNSSFFALVGKQVILAIDERGDEEIYEQAVCATVKSVIAEEGSVLLILEPTEISGELDDCVISKVQISAIFAGTVASVSACGDNGLYEISIKIKAYTVGFEELTLYTSS